MKRCVRIAKMPHHLRDVRGIKQYQRAIPAHLQETVAHILGHKLSEKDKSKGLTKPKMAWFIRSTSTGSDAEAKRVATEKFDPEFRALITRAELWTDAPTIASAIVQDRLDEVPMARIALLSQVQSSALYDLVIPHFKGLTDRQTNVLALTREIRLALETIPLTEKLPALTEIMPKPSQGDWVPVEFETILESWTSHEGYHPRHKSLKAMQGRWRNFFEWLVKERGWPVGCQDMARITGDDLDAYKEYHLKLIASGTIESKTAEWNIGRLTTLLRYGIEEMRNASLRARNPLIGFKNIKGKTAAKNKYQDFTAAEARDILTKAREAKPEIKWAIWLAAHTGGRDAEIVEAQTSDIEVFEPGTRMANGTMIQERTVVFHIRLVNRPGVQSTLKTDFSERPVVLHRDVIAEGFLEYVEQVRQQYHAGGHGPLFPQFKLYNGRLNDSASLELMKWLRGQVGITDPKKTFYSWRHTTKTRFRGTDTNGIRFMEEDMSDKLTGHAGGTIGRTYGYFPIPDLANGIKRVPGWFE